MLKLKEESQFNKLLFFLIIFLNIINSFFVTNGFLSYVNILCISAFLIIILWVNLLFSKKLDNILTIVSYFTFAWLIMMFFINENFTSAYYWNYVVFLFGLIVFPNIQLRKKTINIFYAMIIVLLLSKLIIFSKKQGDYFYPIISFFTWQTINVNPYGIFVFFIFVFSILFINNLHIEYKQIIKLLLFIIALIIYFQTWSRTSLIACIVFYIFDLFIRKIKNKEFCCYLFLLCLILSILVVVFFVLLYKFVPDIKFFNKSIFTGREQTWIEILKYMPNNFIFGLGSNFTFMQNLNPHNVLFGILTYYGIISLALTIFLLYYSVKIRLKESNCKTAIIVLFSLIIIFSFEYMIDFHYLICCLFLSPTKFIGSIDDNNIAVENKSILLNNKKMFGK